MSMMTRYKGEFLSRGGVRWRVEILQETAQAFQVQALTFPASEPLVISWDERDKEEVLCGSAATLRIESPGDRTFADLYTVEPGRIRLDVYRNGARYWSGSLDPEFYEEPYDRGDCYDVEITFSDLDLLERIKYDAEGVRTLQGITAGALNSIGLGHLPVDTSMISTRLTPDGAPLSLADLAVQSANFYDEDDEAATLAEVLTGILQPLGLRMVQRAGRVWIYDLNGLHAAGARGEVEWTSKGQTMGTDKVYNNATITWSPNVQAGSLISDECWTQTADEEIDPTLHALGYVDGLALGNGCTLWSYHYGQTWEEWKDNTDVGFTMWTTPYGGKGLDYLARLGLRYFKISKQNDGEDCEGIAVAWPSVGGYDKKLEYYWTTTTQKQQGVLPKEDLAGLPMAAATTEAPRLLATTPVWLPPATPRPSGAYNSATPPTAQLLRVVLKMLFDVRLNPFEQASDYVGDAVLGYESEWHKQMSERGNYVYVPVKIKCRPVGSSDVWVWNNKGVVTYNAASNTPSKELRQTLGTWMRENSTADDGRFGGRAPALGPLGYLAYYDPADREESTGVGGWKGNRQAIEPHVKPLTTQMAKADDGQCIPYPTFGGAEGYELWVEVMQQGWVIADGGKTVSTTELSNPHGLWDKVRWVLLRMPSVEVVNAALFAEDLDTEDEEYTAELEPAARDSLAIETICGTAAQGKPMARGAYLYADTGRAVCELTRTGRTTQAEELLLGTLYSQYAERRTTLSGEMALLSEGPTAYTEAGQGAALLMVKSDVQDAIEDTSEAVLVEFRPDEYKNQNNK